MERQEEFIYEMLSDKRLSLADRERVNKLISSELAKGTISEKRLVELEERIRRLEGPTKPPEQTVKYISPKEVHKFLIAFNQDPILKSTCHEVDSSDLEKINHCCQTEVYSFEKHLEAIHKIYQENFENIFIDYKIKNFFKTYLTGKNTQGKDAFWSSEGIKINWASPELLKWSRENPGKVPNPDAGLAVIQENEGFKLGESVNSEIFGKRKKIRYFSELVLHFKYLHHLRFDNSLHEIIKNINEFKFNDKSISFIIEVDSFPKNIEILTNVEGVIKAYEKLILLILEVHDKSRNENPDIHLTLKENEQSVDFSILHKNSVYQKTVNNTIGRQGKTYTNLIENQINGMCHFELNADFGNEKFSKINLWDGKMKKSEILPFFQGVEHTLKFLK